MRKILCVLILAIFLQSCSNGKIDYRHDEITNDYCYMSKGSIVKHLESTYLINTSKTNIISYTVKETRSYEGSIKSSETHIYELNPGEEQKIGCHYYSMSWDIEDNMIADYKIVGERIVK